MFIHLIFITAVFTGSWSQIQYVGVNNRYRYVEVNNPFLRYYYSRPIGYTSPLYRGQAPWNPFFQYPIVAPQTTTNSPPPSWLRIYQVLTISMILNRFIFNTPQPALQELPSETTTTAPGISLTPATTIASLATAAQGWSHWSHWSVCNKDRCGIQYRTRQCVSGPCGGLGVDKRDCNKAEPCPLTGSWGSWEAFGGCSEACGTTGAQEYRRTCLTGANLCDGQSQKTEVCNDNTLIHDGFCYAIVFAPGSTISQAAAACISFEYGTTMGFVVVGDVPGYEAIVAKMSSLRPDGLKIWVANDYLRNGLSDFTGSVTWIGGTLPTPVPLPGDAETVMLVSSPSEDGFTVDAAGTAVADGILCGEPVV